MDKRLLVLGGFALQVTTSSVRHGEARFEILCLWCGVGEYLLRGLNMGAS